MKIYTLFPGILISFCALGTTSVLAQGGDQILDGIGETALIARYTFTRDANDRVLVLPCHRGCVYLSTSPVILL